jgi:hypothetical protein
MRDKPEIASHQTVRLKRGSHLNPDHGVCVMELASMLAGERFSDRPRAVSRVIAAFLRTYNDTVGDSERDDLYAYAALCVGTRASRRIERARARACRDWLAHNTDTTRLERWGIHLRPATHVGACAEAAARYLAASPDRHQAALRFLDDLLAVGRHPACLALELRGSAMPSDLSHR